MKYWAKNRPIHGPISDIFISKALAISADVTWNKKAVFELVVRWVCRLDWHVER